MVNFHLDFYSASFRFCSSFWFVCLLSFYFPLFVYFLSFPSSILSSYLYFSFILHSTNLFCFYFLSDARLFLRQFAIEILRSAFNTIIRQVRRILERSNSGHDDSYLLWAIRFFMEFNRLSGFQLPLVRYVYKCALNLNLCMLYSTGM